MEKNIRLELSIEELNKVLEALGNMPFKEVYELIGHIHDQANVQMGGNPIIAPNKEKNNR